MKQILSFGGGVQTFGMLCLIKLERLEKPDLVVFADTQGEKDATYKHMEEVAKPLCKELGLEFVTVSRGDLFTETLARGNTPRPPYCSWMYKRDVINGWLKKNGYTPCTSWIGISLDEEHRGNQKSAVPWVTNRYPLLELELSRYEVELAIKEAGYEQPVKSGCWFCPWNSSRPYWMALKRQQPEKFAKALAMEKETGHKLSNGNFWLAEIDGQTTFNFEELATDEGCVGSVCMV